MAENLKNNVVVYGAGGHGKVVLDILLESGVDVLGFLDDDQERVGQIVNGHKILGDFAYLDNDRSVSVALGIGNNEIRRNIYEKLSQSNVNVTTAIHPKATLSKEITIGRGVVIMAGAIINPSVVIEDGVVVNTGASVDHDCHLEKFVQVWPGAHIAGTVRIGECSYIGMGANVIQNINIGKNVVVGAGAAVVDHIPDDVLAVGVPAKILRKVEA